MYLSVRMRNEIILIVWFSSMLSNPTENPTVTSYNRGWNTSAWQARLHWLEAAETLLLVLLLYSAWKYPEGMGGILCVYFTLLWILSRQWNHICIADTTNDTFPKSISSLWPINHSSPKCAHQIGLYSWNYLASIRAPNSYHILRVLFATQHAQDLTRTLEQLNLVNRKLELNRSTRTYLLAFPALKHGLPFTQYFLARTHSCIHSMRQISFPHY